MNMAKVRKMAPTSTSLGNKTLISKVKDSMKRISEVNDMMAKRETRLVKCELYTCTCISYDIFFKKISE